MIVLFIVFSLYHHEGLYFYIVKDFIKNNFFSHSRYLLDLISCQFYVNKRGMVSTMRRLVREASQVN